MYSLEPPRRGGSNEYPQAMFLSRKKKNVYPCEPQFYYIKVGLRESNLYRYVFMMIIIVLLRMFRIYEMCVMRATPMNNVELD